MLPITERVSAATTVTSPRSSRAITNPVRRGPVVLATDGTSHSGALVLAAELVALQLDLPVEVVSVLEPLPLYNPTVAPGIVDEATVDESRRDARETVVSDYVGRFSGGAAPPRVHVRFGSIAEEIARFARQISATVVVVGAAPHQRRRHIVSGELASHVLRSADCPVLSVPPTFTRLPARAVAAVDFGPSSVRAAQAALLVLDPHGTLILTHVLPTLIVPSVLGSLRGDEPAMDVHDLFDRVRDELGPSVPDGVTLETRLITDDTVNGILSSAERVEADLIAVGTHGPGLFARLFIGSVAGSVIHAADQTVLATPPPPAREAIELLRRVAGVATSARTEEWGTLLDGFTRRNAGRTVMLEVDDPESGSHVAGHGYALRGVTYDPADQRVEVMVGDEGRPLRHLMRSVGRPDSITMSAGRRGHGEVLDIRHGRGHTLVIVGEPVAPLPDARR